eukprot:s3465_g7.t2
MKMDVLVSDHRRIEVVAKGLCPLVRPNLMQTCTPVKLFKEPPDANAIRPTLSSQEGGDGVAQELHRLGAEPAANLDADNDEAALPGACELRVGLVSLTARGSIDSAAGLDVGAEGWASPSRVKGDTIVASRASWDPCQRGRPFATTSMRRASATGTSTFMSASRMLRATLALACRQTRATACSRARRGGGHRAGQAAPTAAFARREREWERQAAQHEGRENSVVPRWRDVENAGGDGPSLGQQQRTRGGCEVRIEGASRMRACSSVGSESLPAFVRPTVAGGLFGGATGCAAGRPIRGTEATVTQVLAREDRSGSTRQDSLTAQRLEQTASNGTISARA